MTHFRSLSKHVLALLALATIATMSGCAGRPVVDFPAGDHFGQYAEAPALDEGSAEFACVQ